MAATIRIMSLEEEAVINRLLEGDGVVLMTQDAAVKIAQTLDITVDELNERYLDSYDYGGDADKWVDVVRTEDHILSDFLKQ